MTKKPGKADILYHYIYDYLKTQSQDSLDDIIWLSLHPRTETIREINHLMEQYRKINLEDPIGDMVIDHLINKTINELFYV